MKPDELLDAFVDAASHWSSKLRVVALVDCAASDGTVTLPRWLTPEIKGTVIMGGTAKLILGPQCHFIALGGAVLKIGQDQRNVGFLFGGPDDDANDKSVEKFRELGEKAGTALHAYDLFPDILSYESPLVFWLLVVYDKLLGSSWLTEMETETPAQHFNPIIASIETLKKLKPGHTSAHRDDEEPEPAPTTPASNESSNEAHRPSDEKSIDMPVLSERKYLILSALLEMGAISADTRETTARIVATAEGNQADPVQFKPDIANLKNAGYVSTKGGRGGGCWLTSDGYKLASRLT